MTAQVYDERDQAVMFYKRLMQATGGWKLYTCNVNGVEVYGVAYNRRDFLAIVGKRYIRDVAEVDTSDILVPGPVRRSSEARKIGRVPALPTKKTPDLVELAESEVKTSDKPVQLQSDSKVGEAEKKDGVSRRSNKPDRAAKARQKSQG